MRLACIEELRFDYVCQSHSAHGSGLHSLHWTSRQIAVGQAPQQFGHTRRPQPVSRVHMLNVLVSLTLAPRLSMTSTRREHISVWKFLGLASTSLAAR